MAYVGSLAKENYFFLMQWTIFERFRKKNIKKKFEANFISFVEILFRKISAHSPK